MGSGVGIVTAGEVTVVGSNDGVGLALLDVLAVPLANAGATGVRQDHTTKLLESLQLTISGYSRTNLLAIRGKSVSFHPLKLKGVGGDSRSGGDDELSLGLDSMSHGILSNGGSAGHILIGGVGARADQTDLDLLRPAVGLGNLLELADGSSQIGGEGTVDVGLEGVEINLNELVVLGTLVLTELGGVLAGEVTNALALGGLEVVVHAVIEGEERSGSTDFSTHVADGAHTRAGEGLSTRAVVFDDGTSSTLDGEDTGNLENDICKVMLVICCDLQVPMVCQSSHGLANPKI